MMHQSINGHQNIINPISNFINVDVNLRQRFNFSSLPRTACRLTEVGNQKHWEDLLTWFLRLAARIFMEPTVSALLGPTLCIDDL
jgi:hypothetical protein